MASVITTKENKVITLQNNIMVDDQVIKIQQFTLNSDNLIAVADNSYLVSGGEALYKENRVEIRKIESAFEDSMYLIQDQLMGGEKLYF